jgi:hypothetical protein
MPSSTIEYRNDVDPVFYTFAAQGSLHYGIEMMHLGVSGMQAATNTAQFAQADALLRHAVDYLHGAAQMAELLRNSFPEDDSIKEWESIANDGWGHMADAKTYRSKLTGRALAKGVGLQELKARANVHWMALMSNRSFNK